MSADAVWLLANLAVLIANLLVLGLTTKLYIEFAKDRFQSSRRVSVDPQ